nr:MAG TPA: hypothetical protein [Caudoviricetes sp.]
MPKLFRYIVLTFPSLSCIALIFPESLYLLIKFNYKGYESVDTL